MRFFQDGLKTAPGSPAMLFNPLRSCPASLLFDKWAGAFGIRRPAKPNSCSDCGLGMFLFFIGLLATRFRSSTNSHEVPCPAQRHERRPADMPKVESGAGATKSIGVSFPLSPALSLGEREKDCALGGQLAGLGIFPA